MTIPIPDFSTNDVSTGFTEFGAPTYVPDQHNLSSNVAINADGANDKIQRAGIFLLGDIQLSYSGWFKGVMPPTTRWIFSQSDLGNDGITVEFNNVGVLELRAQTTSIGGRTETILNSAPIFDDNWHHLAFSVNGNTGANDAELRFTIDGVEPVYTFLNSHSGMGFSTINFLSAAKDYTIAGSQDLNRFLIGIVSRPRVWRVALTVSQMTEEYLNECDSVTFPTPAFEDDNYGDSSVWTPDSGVLFGNDLFNIGTALGKKNSNKSNNTSVVTSGIDVSGDSLLTAAIWWNSNSINSAMILLAQSDSSVSTQFELDINPGGGPIEGRIRMSIFDNGSEANHIASLSSNQFADGIWYLFLFRAKTGIADLFFASIDNPTVTEVSYSSKDLVFGTGYTAMGGATSNLVTGKDVPASSFITGLTARPRIWKNEFLSICQMQKFVNEQIGLLSNKVIGEDIIFKNIIPDKIIHSSILS